MVNPELAEYIAEQTQQGLTAELLRQTLMDAGWAELDIDNAFHDVAAGLSPLTEGASLHEDVSQVRSMVTHLASRIKNIEAVLATTGALPMQSELAGGLGLPSHTLSAGSSTLKRLVYILLAMVLSVGLGGMLLWAYLYGVTSGLYLSGAIVAVGLSLFAFGYMALQARLAWAAAIMTGTALLLWGALVWQSWYVYKAMEWTTYAALVVLLLVLAGVIGRKIGRLDN